MKHKHIWHGTLKGWRYAGEISCLAICNTNVPPGDLALDPSGATCPTCRERYEHRPRQTSVVERRPEVNLQDLSPKDLIVLHNKLAEELHRSPVVRFRDKNHGISQVRKFQRDLKERER